MVVHLTDTEYIGDYIYEGRVIKVFDRIKLAMRNNISCMECYAKLYLRAVCMKIIEILKTIQ